jgi:hypothetical protein
MPRTFEFEVRGVGGAAGEELERWLREEVERVPELRVHSATRDDAVGLTGGEIAIIFVVSALGSATADGLRDHLGAAVRRVAAATGARLRLLLPAAETEQEEDSRDDSAELAKMRDAYLARHVRDR